MCCCEQTRSAACRGSFPPRAASRPRTASADQAGRTSAGPRTPAPKAVRAPRHRAAPCFPISPTRNRTAPAPHRCANATAPVFQDSARATTESTGTRPSRRSASRDRPWQIGRWRTKPPKTADLLKAANASNLLHMSEIIFEVREDEAEGKRVRPRAERAGDRAHRRSPDRHHTRQFPSPRAILDRALARDARRQGARGGHAPLPSARAAIRGLR